MRDERVGVHLLDHLSIARKVLILQVQHMGVRGDVTETLEHREREIRSWHLIGEAFANQPSEL
jgi:hypothetical protein